MTIRQQFLLSMEKIYVVNKSYCILNGLCYLLIYLHSEVQAFTTLTWQMLPSKIAVGLFFPIFAQYPVQYSHLQIFAVQSAFWGFYTCFCHTYSFTLTGSVFS